MEYTKDDVLHDIFVTALEGGIGYWSTCIDYRWSDEEGNSDLDTFLAVIFDHENELGPNDAPPINSMGRVSVKVMRGVRASEFPQYQINKQTIIDGVNSFIREYADTANMYFLRAVRDLNRGNWDDVDVDADIADVIVQLGLFDGEVVYG